MTTSRRTASTRPTRSWTRAALLAAMTTIAAPHALAVGGNDVDTSTKINAATRACQGEIANKGVLFASKTAKAINACLDATVRCDGMKSAAKALACRRDLLRPGAGKCAVGKLDQGATLTGTGAAEHASAVAPTSRAALIKEMNRYTVSIQRKCFDRSGVDLDSIATGLGFSSSPATSLELADETNAEPGGLACLANGLVLRTHPLANDIASVLVPLDQTCVRSKQASLLGTACTTNADCGRKGICGQLAEVMQGGSIEDCTTTPPVCGDGDIGSPETCDDGNVVDGDGCSADCEVEEDCGDGFSVEPEECDDGNASDGDGCSSICEIEGAVTTGAFPATGQTTCWDAFDTPTSCAGTGQDGDDLAGATRAFVDNGDGTITDSNTGLMWEKLSDDAGLHDRDTTYTWDNAVAVKVAALNAASFATHSDWRLPNLNELESIRNLENSSPAADAVFNTSCAASCTVTTCSCIATAGIYWSSSSFAGIPALAWTVEFGDGAAAGDAKTSTHFVRAVRTGP